MPLRNRRRTWTSQSEAAVKEKLAQYTRVRPTSLSIGQFIERGPTKKMSEAKCSVMAAENVGLWKFRQARRKLLAK